jgi:hypothetical protein
MSLAWMSRVWASERPRRSTHRLLLLALADNANDEGVCWPSVATLGRKCATDDRRTMLRQLAWLEAEGFVERERRVGRSTVYRLLLDRLGDGASPADDRVPPGGTGPTGGVIPVGGDPRDDRAPTGGGVAARPPTGDGAPPSPVALCPPEPTENPPKNPQQQQPPPFDGAQGPPFDGAQGPPFDGAQGPREPANRVVPLGAVVGPVLRQGSARAAAQGSARAAAVMREGEEDAVEQLVRRGVDRPVAEELERAHGAESVREAVALYDERRRGPKPPNGPGWLVAAVRRRFKESTPGPPPLLTHDEMLRWCEANGGFHRTADFEPVRQPGQPVLFRRRSDPEKQHPSLSPSPAGEVPAQTG